MVILMHVCNFASVEVSIKHYLLIYLLTTVASLAVFATSILMFSQLFLLNEA